MTSCHVVESSSSKTHQEKGSPITVYWEFHAIIFKDTVLQHEWNYSCSLRYANFLIRQYELWFSLDQSRNNKSINNATNRDSGWSFHDCSYVPMCHFSRCFLSRVSSSHLNDVSSSSYFPSILHVLFLTHVFQRIVHIFCLVLIFSNRRHLRTFPDDIVTRSSSPRIFGHIMFHIVSRLFSFVDVCLFSNIVLSIDKYEYWSCLSTRRLKGSTVVLERVERSSHLCLTFPCGILRASKCIGIVTCYRNLIVFSSTQSNAHVPDSFNESHIDLI